MTASQVNLPAIENFSLSCGYPVHAGPPMATSACSILLPILIPPDRSEISAVNGTLQISNVTADGAKIGAPVEI